MITYSCNCNQLYIRLLQRTSYEISADPVEDRPATSIVDKEAAVVMRDDMKRIRFFKKRITVK